MAAGCGFPCKGLPGCWVRASGGPTTQSPIDCIGYKSPGTGSAARRSPDARSHTRRPTHTHTHTHTRARAHVIAVEHRQGCGGVAAGVAWVGAERPAAEAGSGHAGEGVGVQQPRAQVRLAELGGGNTHMGCQPVMQCSPSPHGRGGGVCLRHGGDPKRKSVAASGKGNESCLLRHVCVVFIGHAVLSPDWTGGPRTWRQMSFATSLSWLYMKSWV